MDREDDGVSVEGWIRKMSSPDAGVGRCGDLGAKMSSTRTSDPSSISRGSSWAVAVPGGSGRGGWASPEAKTIPDGRGGMGSLSIEDADLEAVLPNAGGAPEAVSGRAASHCSAGVTDSTRTADPASTSSSGHPRVRR